MTRVLLRMLVPLAHYHIIPFTSLLLRGLFHRVHGLLALFPLFGGINEGGVLLIVNFVFRLDDGLFVVSRVFYVLLV